MSRYQIMLDPSGRAGCKGKCKQKIPKGALRFGSITASSMFEGDQAYWRRMECMTTKVCQNAIDKYGDLASVPGYDTLDASNQELVQSVFNYHLHGGEPPALPQPGAAESTAEQTKASDKEKPKAIKPKPTLAEDEEPEEEQENASSQEPSKPSKSSKKKKADEKPARAIKKAKPTAAESRRANAAKAEESKADKNKADKDKAEVAKLSRAARAARVRA